MSKIIPPRFAHRFLRWFCPEELYESIEGDLLEDFESDVKSHGLKKAKRKFFWNTLRFLRPGIIFRNKLKFGINQNFMIGNYFKVASRNILKRKLYSFINAFGLSIGIAFCILIFLFIQDERSFDQFHENKSLIYRIEGKIFDTWQNDPIKPFKTQAYLMTPLRQALKDELPEVAYATLYNTGAYCVVKQGDKVFNETAAYVDADFFKIFSFKLLAGNREKLFRNNSEAVITPAIATKYFGDENPLGKTLTIDMEGEKEFTVTGIIEAPPANSSIVFSILLPQESFFMYKISKDRWGMFGQACIVQLVLNTNLAKFKSNLDKISEKYMADVLKQWKERSSVPVPANVKMFEFEFTQLKDWHLKNEVNWNKVSDQQYSWILGGIALLILIIASINYVSLSLTTSASRRIEVGIRKVAGAQKQQLMWQFSIESIALSLISMIIGVGLVLLFLPSFNQFTEKEIAISLINAAPVLLASFVLTIFIGMIAGGYPALFLSGFRPALVLKGTFTSKVNAGFAKPLVVIQFALSAFLIMSSVIMYRQMRYITTKDLGYNKENILVVPTQISENNESGKAMERFRARLLQEGWVISVGGMGNQFMRIGYKINGEQKLTHVFSVDPYYIPTLGIQFLEGRNFDSRTAADSNAVIVNQALVRDMKWKEPLNEYLNYQNDTVGLGAKVIGVVKDYHFSSLEQSIEPMFIRIDKRSNPNTMLIKMTPGNVPEKMEKFRQIWKEMAPDKPLDYSFLDQDVARQYQSYQRWMSIMGLSTTFAILISCLGLFGLSGINAVNRTKEIGIRKVMGANVKNIFILLNRQFIWLALIAFILAVPLSWYVMNKWLASFKFSITIGWELFAFSILSGLMIALATVSYHALKTALINPAETLKHE